MAEQLPVIQSPLNKTRKDRFQLILTIPNILKTINTKSPRESKFINLDSLQFSVYGVNIPSIEVPAVQLPYGGQNYNVTSFSRPAYPPMTINFVVDNEYKNYWLIWKWLQLFNDATAGTYGRPEIFEDGGYPKLDPQTLYDYVTTITVFSLDEYNEKIAEFKFINAFVTKLGGFMYNFRDPEEIDCNFEFMYDQLDMHLV